MTNPEVHEKEHHYDAVGHDDFAETAPLAVADNEQVTPLDHRHAQAARVAALHAMKESGVLVAKRIDVQQAESEAMIQVRASHPN